METTLEEALLAMVRLGYETSVNCMVDQSQRDRFGWPAMWHCCVHIAGNMDPDEYIHEFGDSPTDAALLALTAIQCQKALQ